jgi:hypothetical protein
MVTDGDTGLLVTRHSYEPKHPQEKPVRVFDPQVLRSPAPDLDAPSYTVSWPTGDWSELWEFYPAHVLALYTGSLDWLSAEPYIDEGYVEEGYVE